MSATPIQQRRIAMAILAASIAPFVYRGAEYALIGSYLPLVFVASVVGLLGLSRMLGPLWCLWSVRLWSISLVMYGVLRLGLGVLSAAGSLSHEAHVSEQFTPTYLVVSTAYLAGGVFLLRHAKSLQRGRLLGSIIQGG